MSSRNKGQKTREALKQFARKGKVTPYMTHEFLLELKPVANGSKAWATLKAQTQTTADGCAAEVTPQPETRSDTWYGCAVNLSAFNK
ncbi:MAG: hypothetical protein FWF23_02300 [Alphaproteobacteria bacterium]|nr:hypothetical protein [Alphaproteobacteria bacterium]MCL2505853.1 hypothetical protein [Alphaproteobacteria bacterium]